MVLLRPGTLWPNRYRAGRIPAGRRQCVQLVGFAPQIRYNRRVLSVRLIVAQWANAYQLTSSTVLTSRSPPFTGGVSQFVTTFAVATVWRFAGVVKTVSWGIFFNMETREMCFEAKRLLKLALGPVLMLISAVVLGYGPKSPGQWRRAQPNRRAHLRSA